MMNARFRPSNSLNPLFSLFELEKNPFRGYMLWETVEVICMKKTGYFKYVPLEPKTRLYWFTFKPLAEEITSAQLFSIAVEYRCFRNEITFDCQR